MHRLFFLVPLILGACLNEEINGAQIRAAAFSDSSTHVNILDAGGTRWNDVDIWVAWRGPATLRSNTGYVDCKDKQKVIDHFAKVDPKRKDVLQQTAEIGCLEKPGTNSGRQFLSHKSGIHWWRAWDRS